MLKNQINYYSLLRFSIVSTVLPASLVLTPAIAQSSPEAHLSHSASDLVDGLQVEKQSSHHWAMNEQEFTVSPVPMRSLTEFPSSLEITPESEIIEVAQAESTPAETPQTSQSGTSDNPAQTPEAGDQPANTEKPSNEGESPVLQRWQKEVPNVLQDIRNDPSFRTRFRLGLSYFPSTFDSLGWNVGVEDVFVGRTALTVSGDYQATFTGDRKAGGGELRYYLLPLGGYFNISPVLGYRYLETPRYISDGLNVGFRLQAVLSRTGAADLSFTQTWVGPQQSDEVGITKLSFGFALTRNLRISTDIEKQNSKKKKDTRFGVSFEWMLR